MGQCTGLAVFLAQFRDVYEDTDIDMADTIEYLMLSIVESSPVTPEHCAKIVESLKARFGRDDLQVEVYIREVLTLVLRTL